MSPLEYLFFVMMSAQNPDPSAIDATRIEPSSGDQMANQSVVINDAGKIQMKTILMEPRDPVVGKIEAPLRVMAEWLPWFKIGTDLNITLDESGKTYPAHISRIERITDAQGETIQVILELPRDDQKTPELQPGMTGIVRMENIQ